MRGLKGLDGHPLNESYFHYTADYYEEAYEEAYEGAYKEAYEEYEELANENA